MCIKLYTDFITVFEWPAEEHYGSPYGCHCKAPKRTYLGLSMRVCLMAPYTGFWPLQRKKIFCDIPPQSSTCPVPLLQIHIHQRLVFPTFKIISTKNRRPTKVILLNSISESLDPSSRSLTVLSYYGSVSCFPLAIVSGAPVGA